MIEHKVYPDGSQAWFQNGKPHRLDGPAYIDADGTQTWWQNGLRHRLDGPAIIWADNGPQEWYVNGKNITLEVKAWVAKHNIKLPFSERSALLFRLRFL